MASLHDELLVKDFVAEVSGLSSWLLTSYVMMSRHWLPAKRLIYRPANGEIRCYLTF